MDTLHNEQSAFKDEKFCKTFYEIFKAIVNDNYEAILDDIVLPISPYEHKSRKELDQLLLHGYCRTNEKQFNLNIEIKPMNNIIELVLLFYHIPIILSQLDFNITENDIIETRKLYEVDIFFSCKFLD